MMAFPGIVRRLELPLSPLPGGYVLNWEDHQHWENPTGVPANNNTAYTIAQAAHMDTVDANYSTQPHRTGQWIYCCCCYGGDLLLWLLW